MKKWLFILSWLVSSNFIYSQQSNISYPTDKTFMYGGKMTEELYNFLEYDEQMSYLECLRLCGLNKDSILWLGSDSVENIVNQLDFFSERVSWCSTKDVNGVSRIVNVGQKSLIKPQCIVFIRRQYGITEFTFQMYY